MDCIAGFVWESMPSLLRDEIRNPMCTSHVAGEVSVAASREEYSFFGVLLLKRKSYFVIRTVLQHMPPELKVHVVLLSQIKSSFLIFGVGA